MIRKLIAIHFSVLYLSSCGRHQEKNWMNNKENEINKLFSQRKDILDPATAYHHIIRPVLLSPEISADTYDMALKVLYEMGFDLFFIIEKACNSNPNTLFDLETWQYIDSCVAPKCSIEEAPTLLTLVKSFNNANSEISFLSLVRLINSVSIEDYNHRLATFI